MKITIKHKLSTSVLQTASRSLLVTVTLFFGMMGLANATLIDLQWDTTVSTVYGLHPAIVGETITTTIRVDNGDINGLGQIWNTGDFIKYRVDGASGWWFESVGALGGGSTGAFSTDASGVVISVGNWSDFTSTSTATTSWSGAVVGGWWNNGYNGIHGAGTDLTDYLKVNNVSDNLVASNWSVNSVNTVSEPSAIVLMLLSLAGLSFACRRKIT